MFSAQIADELTAAMRAIFGKQLRSIVLYGSAARGENTAESDIDLALFLTAPMTPEQLDDMATWFANAGLKYGMVFSPIDIEQSLFDRWAQTLPFYRNIQKEGIVLWKAA